MLFRSGCIELDPNPPCSSSESCAFVTDGDDEEEGMSECERDEVRRLRSCGGEYGGCGPDPYLSSVREGDKDEDALREDDGCLFSWLLRRCGNGWYGVGLGCSVPVLILDGVGDFPSLFVLAPETEEAPNDARFVMTGFLRRPRNLTSEPENRPTTPSQ